MTGGSQQLRRFRIARRDGASIEEAAALADIPIGEARLHAKADETDPPPPEAYELIGHNRRREAVKNVEETEADDNPMAVLAADTLRGDVRDSLLSWFKAQPKHWSMMSEGEQRDLADAADRYSSQMVKQACQIIAANERPCIVATLVEYKEKDGVEAKLKLPSRGEVVAALHEACGREVLVTTSGAEEYLGEAAPADIDADQPELHGIGAEYEDA